MKEATTIQKLDAELLALMVAVCGFTKGRTTLEDLRKAEDRAEMFRCWEAY